MDCTCSMSASISEDEVDVIVEQWQTARKNHVCVECGRIIGIGEQYYFEKYFYDGFRTSKTCTDCMSLRQHLVGDFRISQMRDLIESHIEVCDGEIPEACIAKLTPDARGWVCGIIERCWDGWEDEE